MGVWTCFSTLVRVSLPQQSWNVDLPDGGQFHTFQRTHQHAVTLWQCWLSCSKAEHYKDSSCLCSISIPDRGNVMVSTRMVVILGTYVFYVLPSMLEWGNLGHREKTSMFKLPPFPSIGISWTTGPLGVLALKVVQRKGSLAPKNDSWDLVHLPNHHH